VSSGGRLWVHYGIGAGHVLTAVPLGVELFVPLQPIFLVFQAGGGSASSVLCQEQDICDCRAMSCLYRLAIVSAKVWSSVLSCGGVLKAYVGRLQSMLMHSRP